VQYFPAAILILFLSSCLTEPNKLDGKAETLKTQYKEQIDSAKYLIDKGPLSGKTKTLNVSYAAIMCPCPQWFETKYAGDTINDFSYFYLEPDNSDLVDADTLFNGEFFPIHITVTGQFYTKKGYPSNYFPTKGNPEPARVFKYAEIKIIQRGKTFGDRNGL
jgi:hypothetical protein